MSEQRWLVMLRLRLRSLFRHSEVEQDLSEELQYHLDQKTEEYMGRDRKSVV